MESKARAALCQELRLYRSTVRIEQTKPRGIPNLVGKVSVGFNLLLVPTCICCANLRQRKTRCIYPKFIKDLERIDAIHLGLGHPLSLAVEDRARHKDVRKWLLPHKLHPHHHHTRNPQKDNVAGSNEH